eukprot:TRINITY_DN36089_c0_g1_i1.p1 TRINITY_DN36089_c0_g1~~TRINITY_DN36089_c0_g1_i1.p1  ORF type:complete len:587 (+),score=204.45 TRINITY_DN36089_c0_g1_i1:134-1894(+)
MAAEFLWTSRWQRLSALCSGDDTEPPQSPSGGTGTLQWRALTSRCDEAAARAVEAKVWALFCALVEFAAAAAVLGTASLLPAGATAEPAAAGTAGVVAACCGAAAAARGCRRSARASLAAHSVAAVVGVVYAMQFFAPAPPPLRCTYTAGGRDFDATIGMRSGATCAFGREDAPALALASCAAVASLFALAADSGRLQAVSSSASASRARLLHVALLQHASAAREATSKAAPETAAHITPDHRPDLTELLPAANGAPDPVATVVAQFASEWVPWASASLFDLRVAAERPAERAAPRTPTPLPSVGGSRVSSPAALAAAPWPRHSRTESGPWPLRHSRTASGDLWQNDLLGSGTSTPLPGLRAADTPTMASSSALQALQAENQALRLLLSSPQAPPDPPPSPPPLPRLSVTAPAVRGVFSPAELVVRGKPVWKSDDSGAFIFSSCRGDWLISQDLNDAATGAGGVARSVGCGGSLPPEQGWLMRAGHQWREDPGVTVSRVQELAAPPRDAWPIPTASVPSQLTAETSDASDEVVVVAAGRMPAKFLPAAAPAQQQRQGRKARWRQTRARRRSAERKGCGAGADATHR